MKGWNSVTEIKRLLEEGNSVSSVARKLGVDRKTVRKYRDMTLDEYAGNRQASAGRTKKVAHFQKLIEDRIAAMKAEGVINAQAIFQECQKLGYEGSARSLRRWVSQFRGGLVKKRVYRPFETEPGHQAMVDFGEKRKVNLGGTMVTLYFAAMVLSYSRKKYVSVYDRPIDTEMFLNFHQEAFAAFEGIPGEIVYDQTKVAVIQERYGEVDFNESFYHYAQLCRFKPYICRKYDPETKGKVEAVISYVKKNFLLGKSFASMGDLDGRLQTWLVEVANRKVHETTGEIPDEAWTAELSALMPQQQGRTGFGPAFRIQGVSRDGLVKVLGNRYSVPHHHQSEKVKVRITEEHVAVHDLAGNHLWTHIRHQGKGKRILEESHYHQEEKEPVNAVLERLATAYGEALARAVKKNFPRHVREQCQRMLSLSDHYKHGEIIAAVSLALQGDCVSYRNIKYLLEQKRLPVQEETQGLLFLLPAEMPPDMQLIDRDPAYYDGLREVAP